MHIASWAPAKQKRTNIQVLCHPVIKMICHESRRRGTATRRRPIPIVSGDMESMDEDQLALSLITRPSQCLITHMKKAGKGPEESITWITSMSTLVDRGQRDPNQNKNVLHTRMYSSFWKKIPCKHFKVKCLNRQSFTSQDPPTPPPPQPPSPSTVSVVN